jgi:hypothetical protein
VLFQNREQRDNNLPSFQALPDVQCVAGGRTTIEIGTKGIDKALSIDFLDHHFQEVLEQMGYRPHPKNPIQPQLHHSIVIVDGDDTLYEKPADYDLLANHFGNSYAHQAVLDYLEAGGILAINSGNDLERTRLRLLNGIPHDKNYLLSHIILIGCGSAILSTFAANTELIEFKPFRKKSLREKQNSIISHLDAVYLGDDHSPNGNDYSAFQKVGFDRSICVSPLPIEKIPIELQKNYIGSTHLGTKLFLINVLNYAKSNPGHPLFTFSNITKFVKQSRDMRAQIGKTANYYDVIHIDAS